MLWHRSVKCQINLSFKLSIYSKLEYSTSFNPQNSNSAKLKLEKKPEKIELLEPKLEIIEQKSSLIHAQT